MATWQVTTANTWLEFNTTNGTYNTCVLMDSNHIIVISQGASEDGYIQTFTVNTSTWAVTTANTWLEFDTQSFYGGSLNKIDDTHILSFFKGNITSAQVFAVNTSTWAITTANTALSINTTYGASAFNSYQIDSNHFIAFYGLFISAAYRGYVQTFAVDTSTWAVTTTSTTLNFDTTLYDSSYNGNGVIAIDTNHFLFMWKGSGSDGYIQAFTVDTSTWAVSTANTWLEFDTQNAVYPAIAKIDDNHFVGVWQGGAKPSGFAQVFTVDTSTWAVTTAGASFEFEVNTAYGTHFSSYAINSNHVAVSWAGLDNDGYTQVLEVNTSTWAISTSVASLEFDTSNGTFNTTVKIDNNHFIGFWTGAGSDGYIQAFAIEAPASPNLKSYDTNLKANISTLNTNAIANVKTLDTNQVA